MAIFLLCLLSERADHETHPPVHPWIIYLHASIYLLTSTGMSVRLFPSASVFVAAAFYIHLAYLLGFEPAFGYPPWLRIRVALRLLALAGASLRMLAAGDFDPSRHCDKLGAGTLGCVCVFLALLSLPIMTPINVDMRAHHHEIASAFPNVFVTNFIHWVIGIAFCLAFVGYTFPVLVVLPPGRKLARCANFTWLLRRFALEFFYLTIGTTAAFSQLRSYLGRERVLFFTRMVEWADNFTCLGLCLTLIAKDANWTYWKAQGVEFWLQNTVILAEVITIASIAVGASLPWLGRVTKEPHQKEE
ncbi:unnamed protein product [Hydatigera taeniaeformis]|uniref:Uncharacterized protein n=1 Tax=Hydatigena taeniaeformis TaxID=6205 RepID=A0A0R3X8S3_HYDTA|nr:unnamed protein product [Hydatigera taeniaeformis]